MSRSSRLKEKVEKGGRHSLHDCDDGSAARTRPLSFEEIMLRRENKKLSENVKEVDIEARNLEEEGVVEDVSNRFKSERGYKENKNASHIGEKRVPENSVKLRSGKKEENSSMKKDSVIKDKDRESRESDIKLKDKQNKYLSYESKLGKNDRQIHGRRKNNEWLIDDPANQVEKKYSRDLVSKDRHADRSRGEYERERKRKYGDDEKNRDWNTAKRYDQRKQWDLDVLERKGGKESSKSRYEESRLKRRRSRSQERGGRSRRSISNSPRSHKHKSHVGGEHREFSSHSLKDRSGRQHSDIDKNKVSTNGSSSHYPRHGGYTSGLGGYSPRKRRIEAAVKTSSPPSRSPEKKNAGWDLPPVATSTTISGSVAYNSESSNKDVALTVNEMASAVSVSSTAMMSLPGVSNALLTKTNPSIDTVQLTQATRPMRRLYVDNIPSSASENAVMEYFNNFLLYSGANRIQGTQPCFNCIINKEKGQALVEFLTPGDASAALSFDGSSFSGSILKIRRPKDFVEVATVHLEKSVAAVDPVSDTVKDSPNKIFIGGISSIISSKMLKEIVSAFGPLKAYHFEINEELGTPCAFLEYEDQSVTPKACAGLSGMKLGGRVLTVVQATPDASISENAGYSLCYGIPEQAKALLKEPTQVLMLKNVFDPDGLPSLSEQDVEEVMEDIRLECARFGTVKSVNVVKHSNFQITTSEACEDIDNLEFADPWQDLQCVVKTANIDASSRKDVLHDTRQVSDEDFPSDGKELEEDEVETRNCSSGKPADDPGEDKSCQMGQLDGNMDVEDVGCENLSDGIPKELPNQLNSQKDQSECHDDNLVDIDEAKDITSETKLVDEDQSTREEADTKSQERCAELDGSLALESDVTKVGDNEKKNRDIEHMLEAGCVFVEFGRTEASCAAAHCFHGRTFDNRIVMVEYVAPDFYRERFPK